MTPPRRPGGRPSIGGVRMSRTPARSLGARRLGECQGGEQPVILNSRQTGMGWPHCMLKQFAGVAFVSGEVLDLGPDIVTHVDTERRRGVRAGLVLPRPTWRARPQTSPSSKLKGDMHARAGTGADLRLCADLDLEGVCPMWAKSPFRAHNIRHARWGLS